MLRVSFGLFTLLTTGSAVFLSTSQSNTAPQYAVGIDGAEPVLVDGFTSSASPLCALGWSSFGLKDTNHTVIVTTLGPGPQIASNGVQPSPFELDGFMYVSILAWVHWTVLKLFYQFQASHKVLLQLVLPL